MKEIIVGNYKAFFSGDSEVLFSFYHKFDENHGKENKLYQILMDKETASKIEKMFSMWNEGKKEYTQLFELSADLETLEAFEKMLNQ